LQFVIGKPVRTREVNFITFASNSVRREFSALNGSSVATIVTSVPVGFPKWAVALARDFCENQTTIIPDSPQGWNIHAEYFDGAHRMTIYVEEIVIVHGRIS
jgi:hypothetical protein